MCLLPQLICTTSGPGLSQRRPRPSCPHLDSASARLPAHRQDLDCSSTSHWVWVEVCDYSIFMCPGEGHGSPGLCGQHLCGQIERLWVGSAQVHRDSHQLLPRGHRPPSLPVSPPWVPELGQDCLQDEIFTGSLKPDSPGTNSSLTDLTSLLSSAALRPGVPGPGVEGWGTAQCDH